MIFQTVFFYVFATILVMSALAVITIRNPVHSALFLVLSFATAAGIWLLLKAEFLAIALVLVYVGAVMVLFLFVVMMLDINIDKMREGFWRYLPVAGLVGVILLAEMIAIIWTRSQIGTVAAPADPGKAYSNTKELGRLVYTDYVYPFELAAVVLLVAMVAAIALTFRRRKETKYQNPAEQVRVKRNDRLKIVSMASEKRERNPTPEGGEPQ